VQELGLSPKDARALIEEPETCRYYESLLREGMEPRRAATEVLNPLQKLANERSTAVHKLNIKPAHVRELDELRAKGLIGSSAASEVYALLPGWSRTVLELIDEKGMRQVSDTAALEGYVDQVLADAKNARAIEDIRAGKDKAIGALMGQIMKLSKGQANPQLVTQIIKQKLQGG
ncbi:MAG TPA: hypothetical protein VF184_11115, partial [Phycisphaeraceae bacterium]